MRLGQKDLPLIGPPVGGVFRVERVASVPFAAVAWRFASGGRFGGRFDDPRGPDDAEETNRFRMIYAATNPAAAFAETLAPFRPAPGLSDRVRAAAGDDAMAPAGHVPSAWRSIRVLRHVVLAPESRFVDLWDAQTLAHLRDALAFALADAGLADLDLSAMSGASAEGRQFTRSCALFLRDAVDPMTGRPIDGLRYRSRWGEQWECWAIFSDRLVAVPELRTLSYPISTMEAGLVEVADLFRLRVEPDAESESGSTSQ